MNRQVHTDVQDIRSQIAQAGDQNLAAKSILANIQDTTQDNRTEIRDLQTQIFQATTKTITSLEELKNEIRNPLFSMISDQIERQIDRCFQQQSDRGLSSPGPGYASRTVTTIQQNGPMAGDTWFLRRHFPTKQPQARQKITYLKRFYYRDICNVTVLKIYVQESLSSFAGEDADAHQQNKKDTSEVDSFLVINVQSNVRLFPKGLQVIVPTQHGRYYPGLDLRLRSYPVVSESSPVLEAVRRGDLLKVRKLFAAGKASPFDVGPNGFSLLDELFFGIGCNRQSMDSILSIARFLIENGCNWSYCAVALYVIWISEVLADPIHGPQIIRLFLAHIDYDPFEAGTMSQFITSKLTKMPTYEVLIQQDHWAVDLNHHQIIREGQRTFYLSRTTG